MAEQDHLDALSRQLSALSPDEVCVALVNGLIAQNTSPGYAVTSLLNLISTLSTLAHDDTKAAIANALRDHADGIEVQIMQRTKIN